jgi:hypothetical protein
MRTFYSACEVKEAGLTFGAVAQGVGTEIDFVPLIVDPEDFVAVILKLEIVEASGVGTKKFKHFALCEQRPQVHNAGKTVFPDNLDDAKYDRLCTMHTDDVSHLSSPAFAVLQLPTMHSSAPIDVGSLKIAHG